MTGDSNSLVQDYLEYPILCHAAPHQEHAVFSLEQRGGEPSLQEVFTRHSK